MPARQLVSQPFNQARRHGHEGRRVQKIAPHRGCGFADRFRNRQAGTEGPRRQGRRQGDLGQPGRLQGPQARRSARGRNQNPGLRRRRNRRCRRPRRDPVQGGRRSILRRLDPAAGHECRISSGRRADRRQEAEIAFVRAGSGATADLDHRLGIAVRPARRRTGQERRSAHAADHRRRRRGRLDPDPARAPPHRADGGRYCHAPRVRKNGASTSARMP